MGLLGVGRFTGALGGLVQRFSQPPRPRARIMQITLADLQRWCTTYSPNSPDFFTDFQGTPYISAYNSYPTADLVAGAASLFANDTAYIDIFVTDVQQYLGALPNAGVYPPPAGQLPAALATALVWPILRKAETLPPTVPTPQSILVNKGVPPYFDAAKGMFLFSGLLTDTWYGTTLANTVTTPALKWVSYNKTYPVSVPSVPTPYGYEIARGIVFREVLPPGNYTVDFWVEDQNGAKVSQVQSYTLNLTSPSFVSLGFNPPVWVNAPTLADARMGNPAFRVPAGSKYFTVMNITPAPSSVAPASLNGRIVAQRVSTVPGKTLVSGYRSLGFFGVVTNPPASAIGLRIENADFDLYLADKGTTNPPLSVQSAFYCAINDSRLQMFINPIAQYIGGASDIVIVSVLRNTYGARSVGVDAGGVQPRIRLQAPTQSADITVAVPFVQSYENRFASFASVDGSFDVTMGAALPNPYTITFPPVKRPTTFPSFLPGLSAPSVLCVGAMWLRGFTLRELVF